MQLVSYGPSDDGFLREIIRKFEEQKHKTLGRDAKT